MISLTPADKFAETARLVVKDFKFGAKTEGGLYMPGNLSSSLGPGLVIGVVVSISNDMKVFNADRKEAGLYEYNKGDKMLCYEHSGSPVQLGGETYRIITGADIIATIEIDEKALIPANEIAYAPVDVGLDED